MWIAVIVGAVAAVSGGAIWVANSGGSVDTSLPTAVVERGPMTISIAEDGEVKAEKQQVINNDLRWSAKILDVFPEGKVIKKGQTAIHFECDELKDALDDQEIRSKSADNDYNAATTNCDIKKKQMDALVRKAEQAQADADADLKKYNEAEWEQLQDEAKAKIQLADGELALAKDKLEAKEAINADPSLNKPYSDSEIEVEKLTVERLKLAFKKAGTDSGILQTYTHPRKLRNLQEAVEDAKLELIAANAERDKQLKLAETEKERAALYLRKQQERFTELREDRDTKLDIKAEQTGLVVYETRRRHWNRPITVAVGEKISSGQQLIVIPDAATLVVNTSVYEAVREQVHEGLAARIRLDARPDKSFRGKVSKVAALPDSQNPWLSPGVKVYPTTISFDEDVTGLDLKPGMTCDVEITLAELRDTLSVPIGAVFAEEDARHCYRVRPGRGPERVDVEIGRSSETRVQILSGLSAGDVVLLVPPLGERVPRQLKLKEPEAATMPVGAPEVQGPGPARPDGPRGEGATTRRARPGGPEGATTREARPRRSEDGQGRRRGPARSGQSQ